MRSSRSDLLNLYNTLLNYHGYQNWWPVDLDYHRKYGSDPREEIIIGAILTQNTAWRNVERALANLKREGLLSLEGVLKTPEDKLQDLIRPSGYYRQKAERLKIVATELNPVARVKEISREDILKIKGVGRETADTILLYAGDRLYFVIDAYTKRLIKRLFNMEGSYEDLKSWFESSLPKDLTIYKEFHALLDEHAKGFCRTTPVCNGCVLRQECSYDQGNKKA